MNFDLEQQECVLENFNPRREIHGEDPQPASDLKFIANLSADVLALFSPTLRFCLFHKVGAADDPDMINRITERPNLRFPKLKPLGWDDEMVGAHVTVDHGLGGKSDLNFEDCKVNNFTIEPAEGGRFTLTFRVQCHPGEREAGKLYLAQGQKVTVTIKSPAESDDLPANSAPLNTAGNESAPNGSKRGRKSRTAALV